MRPLDIVYLVRHDDDGTVIYATSDANQAITKSIALIHDQAGHVLEAWLEDKKISTIDIIL